VAEPAAPKTRPHVICEVATVVWLIFIVSTIILILDALEVIHVEQDEIELAVVLLSGALAFALTVACGVLPEVEVDGATDEPPEGAEPGADTEAPPEPVKKAHRVDPSILDEIPPIFRAAEAGDVEALRTMLEEGADVDARKRGGATALMAAAYRGHVEIVHLLLSKRAQVDVRAKGGYTALYLATQEGYVDIVRALLEAGADPDLQTKKGASALQVVAQQGSVEVARVLLDHGASVEIDSQFVPRPMVIAMYEGHEELRELLAEATPGLLRVDGLSYLRTLREDELPVGEARLSEDRFEFSGKRPSHPEVGDEWAWLDPPEGHGRCYLFVFDYSRMSSAYGADAFAAVGDALEGSSGVCAFLHGDLEVAAGGPSRVPGLLMEIRDAGWIIGTSGMDSPLVRLGEVEALPAYGVAMWTDQLGSFVKLDQHLTARFPEAYLGHLQQSRTLDISQFHDLLRPLQLPVRGTYVDGHPPLV